MILAGGEATAEMRSDTSELSDLSASQFDSLCEECFDEENMFEILLGDSDEATEFDDSIGIPDDQLDRITRFLGTFIRKAAEHDLIESQIQQDLVKIGIQEERADELAANIDGMLPKVRVGMVMTSRVDPLPRLLDFNWSIEKTVATPTIDGAGLRRVFFEIEYGYDEDTTETVKFQTDERGAEVLDSNLEGLTAALSEGMSDVEKSDGSE